MQLYDPLKPPPATRRRRRAPRRKRALARRSRGSVARAIGGAIFGWIAGWFGIQFLAWRLGRITEYESPEAYAELINRASTQLLFFGGPLVLAIVVAALVYRD